MCLLPTQMSSCKLSTILDLINGGIEMDVAWGHVTQQYGLHRPSSTGPIFVYRVCTHLQWTAPPRVQILTHANLSPEQVLSAIAGHFPDLRDTWADEAWHLTAIDITRGHSRDRSLMHPCYVLIQAEGYWAFNQRPHGLVELVVSVHSAATDQLPHYTGLLGTTGARGICLCHYECVA